jgi:chromosome segregation ATPase
MDLEKALLKINELESELSTLKKTVSNQSTKVSNMDEKVSNFLDTVRDQKKEIDRMNSIIAGLGQFDATIIQLRVDFTRMIEECEKRIQTNEKTQEKLRMDEVKALNLSIDRTKRDLTLDFDQNFKTYLEENSRLVQKFKDIQTEMEKKIQGNEEYKSGFNLLQQEFRQQTKRVESHAVDFENFKKRQDEIRTKLDVILGDIRTNENRLNELVTTEADRKQSYVSFVGQLTVDQRERERIWADWQQQFEESTKQIYRALPELQNQQSEMNKTKAALDDVTQRFERRINELTEMYRLMDEKFRQEWATFKSDSDKKWSNISLVFDEKQGGFAEQFGRLKERMIAVEDSTHEMQDVLLLMSKEIQNGMQSLMNMVNGWMDAFGEIKTTH